MGNVEANMAWSKHLSDLDDLGRQVAAYITDARFGIRHGVPSGLDSMDAAHSAMCEFQALALRLVQAQEAAKVMAQATGSRGATYITERRDIHGDIVETITGVWGEV